MLYDIRKISLHLIFEKDNFKKCPFVFLFGMSRDRWRVLKNYKTSINKIKKLPKLFDVYPINVARNIGRLGKTTELFLSGDIENYASYRYESKVSKLANQLLLKDKKRAVLVHRRFEIDNNITIPRTKYELEKLYINKKSFVFHTFFYIQGHYIPGLNKWFKVPENYVNTSIFNIINYTQPDWEPQFVGDDRVPYHDERFPYRIRSNTHLAHIMCHQQFKFIILNDVFTIHEGIKRGYKKYEETAANTSLTSTRKIIFHFNDFLKKKYPHMSGVCPRLRI
uniref:N-acetyllactosaminide beta-1,3-N-acetylglucosaminyltransferase n=1 Tax=Parastrongyloides trichosuri TaxID=131310 RepID=A0A0N5A790_PARTI